MAECTHKSKENLTAASVPKYEKYKGNDNVPVINKIVLLAFTKVRKPINAIFQISRIRAFYLTGQRTKEIA